MSKKAKVIDISNVSVSFGSKLALSDVSLSIEKGELYGLLGPNGAGKSTLFRVLTGLIHPNSGKVAISNIDVLSNRIQSQEQFVYLPGDVHLYDRLSGQENLDFLGNMHSQKPSRQKEILERFKFDKSDLRRKVKNYSSGMRQKIAIASVFQHDTPIYILDEPTMGLDPFMQSEFALLIEEENKKGKTIVLSSHTLSEVERVCRRIGIIRQGEIVYDGLLDDLRGSLARKLDAIFSSDVPHNKWEGLEGLQQVDGTKRHHLVTFMGDPKAYLATLAQLPVENISIENASLEEAFKQYYKDKNDV